MKKLRNVLLLCGVHRRERRPVREKHIGDESINFYPLEKLARIAHVSCGAGVIFLFLEQPDEHGRDAGAVFEQ